MPRSHGRIMAAIWNDPDFLALDVAPQRLYMFLLSQPDLSHAGLVPMRVRRWAKKAANSSPGHIEDNLLILAEAKFIVTDEDTEEVLVRTLVRNDGVYKQPRVMDRMREDAKQIESARLRAVFREELQRLPLDELSDKPGGPSGDQPSTRAQVERVVKSLLEDFEQPSKEGIGDPSERVSETLPDTPRVCAQALPLPPSPSPHPPSPVPPTAGGGEPSAQLAIPDHAPTTQTLIGEWIEHCPERPPQRVIGQVSKELKALLGEGIDPQRVRSALAEWNRKGLHPATLPSVVHEITNRAATTRGQQATDDMFDRAMQRAIERERSAS